VSSRGGGCGRGCVGPVRGEELGQRRQQLLGGLLGEEVAVLGMTTLWTSGATARTALPTISPKLRSPPIAMTGMVGGRFLRSRSWAMVASIARYHPKLPRSESWLERVRT
jgi:hypothetical protein